MPEVVVRLQIRRFFDQAKTYVLPAHTAGGEGAASRQGRFVCCAVIAVSHAKDPGTGNWIPWPKYLLVHGNVFRGTVRSDGAASNAGVRAHHNMTRGAPRKAGRSGRAAQFNAESSGSDR